MRGLAIVSTREPESMRWPRTRSRQPGSYLVFEGAAIAPARVAG
jgi:hypothetical protein